jgi:hypothetical protein
MFSNIPVKDKNGHIVRKRLFEKSESDQGFLVCLLVPRATRVREYERTNVFSRVPLMLLLVCWKVSALVHIFA